QAGAWENPIFIGQHDLPAAQIFHDIADIPAEPAGALAQSVRKALPIVRVDRGQGRQAGNATDSQGRGGAMDVPHQRAKHRGADHDLNQNLFAYAKTAVHTMLLPDLSKKSIV